MDLNSLLRSSALGETVEGTVEESLEVIDSYNVDPENLPEGTVIAPPPCLLRTGLTKPRRAILACKVELENVYVLEALGRGQLVDAAFVDFMDM